MKMGISRVVTSDQGKEFNNMLNRQLMRLLKIEYRLTTPYHPQVSHFIFSNSYLKQELIII